MGFAIVTGWQAIIKSIFPAAIDVVLLKLVHLSNAFRVVEGQSLCKSATYEKQRRTASPLPTVLAKS